jgi:hypothetical protein
MARPVLLVLCIASIVACTDDTGPNQQDEGETGETGDDPPAKFETYAVEGEDCDAVRMALFPAADSHPGMITCGLSYPYGFTAAPGTNESWELTLGNVMTSYDITIRLPQWNAPEGADTRCWEQFITALTKHEEAHADVCRQHIPAKLMAIAAALEGKKVQLEGPCEVDGAGQVILSEAQGDALDAAVQMCIAQNAAVMMACMTYDAAQDAVDNDPAFAAILDCNCP